jgi:glycosyltransferase involved in cell wall biosynthesis
MKKSIVFITSRFPYPLNKGDKLRAYHQIKDLSKYASVHLVCVADDRPSDEDLDAMRPFCASINVFFLPKWRRVLEILMNVFSGIPPSVSYFYSSSMAKEVDEICRRIMPNVVHCHLIRTAKYIPKSFKGIRSIDYMDCFSIGAKKELGYSTNVFRKLLLNFEYSRLRKFERTCYHWFDKHFIISKPDRESLPFEERNQVHILLNGVDFDSFFPKKMEKKFDVLFSGHMGYIPNITAAKYSIENIMPILPEELKLLVAGIGVTPEIRELEGKRIIVQENFPHIREAFWTSKILLAPMNISIGLQNKILQAMAMRIPVVCSSAANASVNAVPGISILEANTPEEYRDHVLRLIDDEGVYNNIADNALDFVQKHFVWEKINGVFAEQLFELNGDGN